MNNQRVPKATVRGQNGDTVIVAIYTHPHGSDARAFCGVAGAEAWRDQIAREWWDEEFPALEMPATGIGTAYFAGMNERDGSESFEILHLPIEEASSPIA